MIVAFDAQIAQGAKQGRRSVAMTLPAELGHQNAARLVLDAITAAHDRDPFVGGLFNAYEPAVHYEIFSAALARGLHDTWQEPSLGDGQKSCDLALPLADGRRLWLEVKQWWFLFDGYANPYVNQRKTFSWPASDWKRLAELKPADARALLLLRCWSGARGKEQADKWLSGLRAELSKTGASDSCARALTSCSYMGEQAHERHGDALLWVSGIDT